MSEQTNLEGQPVFVPIKGVIVLPQLDVSKYVGMKVEIERVETFKGQYGYYLKLSTKVLDANPKDQNGRPINDKDGNPIQLRATRVLGLFEDADGNIGWGEQTKTGLFMAKLKVNSVDELRGKVVQVVSTTSKSDGKDYLTIN